MKLVAYRCECGHETEKLFRTEEIKDGIPAGVSCEECGRTAEMFNFKNNSQVWKYFDTRR